MNMDEIVNYVRASKDVLDMLKTLGELLPKGQRTDAVSQRLAEAEKALRASEVQLAKALNYRLCQCTFPPQIMLSSGYHDVHDVELFSCPKCGKRYPSDHQIRSYDELKAQNRSWTGEL